MRKISLILTMVLAMVSMAFAQRTISGAVTDDKGQALMSATVVEKGTTNGTATDMDGKYALPVKDGATLVFSYVGYTTQEIPIGASNALNVTMSEGEAITEVVVTALNVSRDQKSLGYSTQKVDGSVLQQNRETNVINSLAGRIAGVQINGASGNMGGSSRVLIRGARSVTGENQALFVVDGVPMDNSNFTTLDQARGAGGYDYGNAIQDINPDDIESVNVLKGGAAAALYGSRGANGVIMITTKKGSASRNKKTPIGITINSSVASEEVMLLPALQNSYGGGYDWNGTDAAGVNIPDYATDESWGPKLDGSPHRGWYSWDAWDTENYGKATPWSPQPNNVHDFFEKGLSFTNNIAVTGGNEMATFRASYTNLTMKGVMPNSSLNRNTISFNGSLNPTDKLHFTMGANYVVNAGSGRPGTGYDGLNVTQQFFQWGQRQWDITNMRKYINPDGTQRTWNRTSAANGAAKYTDNPYWTRYMNYQNDQRDRFFGNIAATYDINKNWSMTYRAMNDFYTDRRQERVAVGSQDIPSYIEDLRTVSEFNSDAILNYNKAFGSKVTLKGFVGGNIRRTSYKGTFAATQGGLNVPLFYNIANSTASPSITTTEENKGINSAFASASLGISSMFYLDATARNDWSSTLPEGNNSYFYPSVSGSFVFTELGALKDNKILSFGKVRAGWSRVGNDAAAYSLASNYLAHPLFGSSAMASVPNRLNNPNLRNETTDAWEVGGEFRLFKDRVGLSVTHYNSLSYDLILAVPTSASTGYSSQLLNAGKISNTGWELALSLTPIKTKNFSWDMNINWSKNTNKVVEFKLPDGSEPTKYRLANAPFAVEVAALVGQPYGTIMGTDFTYTPDGQKIMDASGVYVPSATPVALGTTLADWTGGINNSFTYKGLSLAFLIDGQMGGSIFSTSHMWGTYSGLWEETAANEIREKGTDNTGAVEQPDGTFKTETVHVDAFTQFQGNSAYTLARYSTFDATYFKLREVRLAYTLPAKWFEKAPVRSVTASLVARNVSILYKKAPGIDPDYVNSSGNVQGIEGAYLPPTRTISFNLNLNF
jgi:TonB-linked SusC/RagA family outer membrane protein